LNDVHSIAEKETGMAYIYANACGTSDLVRLIILSNLRREENEPLIATIRESILQIMNNYRLANIEEERNAKM
jgi:hypothetical protein